MENASERERVSGARALEGKLFSEGCVSRYPKAPSGSATRRRRSHIPAGRKGASGLGVHQMRTSASRAGDRLVSLPAVFATWILSPTLHPQPKGRALVEKDDCHGIVSP